MFIDEIDALAPSIGKMNSESDRRIVTTLLALMDGVETDNVDKESGNDKSGGMKPTTTKKKKKEKAPRLMVLAATNRPQALEPALRRPGL